jgi:mercuric ion transport protein
VSTVELREKRAATGRGPLMLAAVSSGLASTCCVLPLVLVLLGFSGAWMTHLRVLRPYSSLLIALSLLALVFAWKPVFRPTAHCGASGIVGARSRRALRTAFVIISAFTATLLLVPCIAPLFY